MLDKLKTNQSGSVLVISMIILIVFAAIISLLALIVMNNLRYVTGYSQAQQSFNAAESGVEQTLYFVEAARTAKIIDVSKLITIVNSVTTNTPNYDVSLMANSDTSIQLDLANQTTTQLNLYTEIYHAAEGYLITNPLNIKALQVQWPNAVCEDGHNNSLELSNTAWTSQSWNNAVEDPSTFQMRWVYDNCSSSTGCSYGLQTGFLYKMRLKALYCQIPNLVISAMDTANKAIPLQERLALTSSGSMGSSEQQITAEVLWRTPLNDYFDYVLFSEEQITK